MLDIIQSESRGSADHGWLRAKHTFSFAEYQNPDRVEFGKLRVINEDRIAPGKEHKDSMGNGTVITAGEIQRMTAGTGVRHSEFNHSRDKELHLLQIWIYPEENGLEPGYEQTRFPRDEKLNRLRLVGSRDGRNGSVTIHQDVDLYASILEENNEVSLDLRDDRKVFVQVVDGDITVNGQELSAGDGAQLQDETKLRIKASAEAEFLVFDMH
jgi:redox-sensitive bicupin YhaK (pirin superfamily)